MKSETKTLDLHGIRHNEVERLVENFVILNEPPLTIICGNSDRMISIVNFKLNELLKTHLRDNVIDSWRWGVIRVL